MNAIPLYPLALTAGLLPIIGIHLCYLWAASNGHVDWCIPYLDSCTSISATGRNPPESYLFKALMIPSAVVLAVYWWACCRWLVLLGCTAPKRRVLVQALALVASVGLILYTVVLDSIGDNFYLQRRIGATSFFGFSYLAQLLLLHLLGNTQPIRQRYRHWLRRLEISTLSVFVVGLISITIGFTDDDLYRRTDDAFEWTLTLLLCVHVLIMAGLWRRCGYRCALELNR